MKKIILYAVIAVLVIALVVICVSRLNINASADMRMATLYAVKPDDTYILTDAEGNLWEVDKSVDIEEDNVLLLEIENNHVVRIWAELSNGDGEISDS